MAKTLEFLLRGLEILQARGNLQIPVTGLSYDSRKVRPGDMFVAIRGTRADGNQFILDARQRGATVIIAEDAPENGASGTFIQVADSRKALARISANFFEHPSNELKLIGVTGTNGKTTTTLLIESILKHEGYSVGVIGTLAYRWGTRSLKAGMTTPESFELQKLFREMRNDGVTHLVMEVSSHALSMGRIEGCTVDAGVFTNLSQDHLDFHSSMEEYFLAKASLFEKHLGGSEGTAPAVINLDDPYGLRLIEARYQNLWSYSVSSDRARVHVIQAKLDATGIQAEISTPHGRLPIHSPLLGRLNLYNVLAATTTALALGADKESIVAGLQAVSFVDGRLQRVPVPPDTGYEVVVDYAHTPDAMEKSLTCLREMTKGRLLTVFGCGGDRDRGKRPQMGNVAAALSDIVIVTSDNPRSELPEAIIRDIEPGILSLKVPYIEPDPMARPRQKAYTMERDRKKAIELALRWAEEGDMVFIGGKGHETYQIIGNNVLPFDDREIVREYFQEVLGVKC